MGQAWKVFVGVEDQLPIWHNDLRNGQGGQHVPETGSYILEGGSVWPGIYVDPLNFFDGFILFSKWNGGVDSSHGFRQTISEQNFLIRTTLRIFAIMGNTRGIDVGVALMLQQFDGKILYAMFGYSYHSSFFPLSRLASFSKSLSKFLS